MKGLKYWVGREWSSGLFSNGLEAIKACAENFLIEKRKVTAEATQNEETELGTPLIKTPQGVKTPENYFETRFFESDQIAVDDAMREEIKKKDISKEIDIFRKLLFINNSKIIKECSSTSKFWLSHKLELPNLFNLVLILMNINASSAFIERYFSICGFVQDKRRMNIAPDLFKTRCLLRANIKILNELNKNEEIFDDE